MLTKCDCCGAEFNDKAIPNLAHAFCSRECYRKWRAQDRVNTFWKSVTKTDRCWLWKGSVGRGGYGRARFLKRRVHPAHRVAWLLTKGAVPQGLFVCHRCDNPLCVNPNHLFLGKPSDNSADMVRKGRSLQGERHPQRKITMQDVLRIRQKRMDHCLDAKEEAIRLGVTPSHIRSVARGVTWKHTLKKGSKPKFSPCVV